MSAMAKFVQIPTGIKEKRLCHKLFETFGHNMKELGVKTIDPYREAIQDKDVWKLLMATPAAASRLFWQGFDHVYAGVAGDKLERIKPSEFETFVDAGAVPKKLSEGKPISAITRAIKVPGDMANDLVDAVGGFEGSDKFNAKAVQSKTRREIQSTIAA